MGCGCGRLLGVVCPLLLLLLLHVGGAAGAALVPLLHLFFLSFCSFLCSFLLFYLTTSPHLPQPLKARAALLPLPHLFLLSLCSFLSSSSLSLLSPTSLRASSHLPQPLKAGATLVPLSPFPSPPPFSPPAVPSLLEHPPTSLNHSKPLLLFAVPSLQINLCCLGIRGLHRWLWSDPSRLGARVHAADTVIPGAVKELGPSPCTDVSPSAWGPQQGLLCSVAPQNHEGWKRPLRSPNPPSLCPTSPPLQTQRFPCFAACMLGPRTRCRLRWVLPRREPSGCYLVVGAQLHPSAPPQPSLRSPSARQGSATPSTRASLAASSAWGTAWRRACGSSGTRRRRRVARRRRSWTPSAGPGMSSTPVPAGCCPAAPKRRPPSGSLCARNPARSSSRATCRSCAALGAAWPAPRARRPPRPTRPRCGAQPPPVTPASCPCWPWCCWGPGRSAALSQGPAVRCRRGGRPGVPADLSARVTG